MYTRGRTRAARRTSALNACSLPPANARTSSVSLRLHCVTGNFEGLNMTRLQYGFLLLLLAVSQIFTYSLLVFNTPDTSLSTNRDIDPEQLVISIVDELAKTRQYQTHEYKIAGNLVEGAQLQALIRDAVKSELELVVVSGQNNNSRAVVSKDEHQTKQVTLYDQIEQEAALSRSSSLIDQAISAGRWTEQHTQELLPQLSSLSENQRIKLLEKFHGAVNRQEIELEDVPPL